jgi:hypothetical protein
LIFRLTTVLCLDGKDSTKLLWHAAREEVDPQRLSGELVFRALIIAPGRRCESYEQIPSQISALKPSPKSCLTK